MEFLFSQTAVASFIKDRMNSVNIALFEGTPPTSLASLPFNPLDVEDVLKNAVLTAVSENVGVTYDPDNKRSLISFDIYDNDLQERYASYQYIPTEALRWNNGYNRPVVKVFTRELDGIPDERTIAYMLGRQRLSAPAYGSAGGHYSWGMSEFHWTYFEAPKEILLDELIFTRNRYSGTGDITLQYLDPADGVWKDPTGQGLTENDKNLNWAGNYENEFVDFNYAGTNNNTMYPYQVIFKNPVTTKLLRMRSASSPAVPENKSVFRTMYNFSIGTTTDLSDVGRSISPTWGIAYGYKSSRYNLLDIKKDFYFVFEITSEAEGGDLPLSSLTFDPKEVSLGSLNTQPLSFSIYDMVE